MNELHEKINQAKKDLGLNSSELSTALGYSKPYITKALIKLPGDKVQKRLIGEIDVLINNEKKRVAEVINCYFDKKHINRSSIDCRVKSKTFNDGIFGRCEVKPDLQLQNSAKSKVLNKERLECRASGSAASVKSIDTGEIIKQKDLKIAKRECELFWSTKAIKDKNYQIEKLQSKISNERILSVIIFAVMLALFLASHAI